MAVTQGIPAPWGPLATRVGLLPPGLLGGSAAKQAILCVPFFLFGTEEPKEPQRGGVDALVNAEDLTSGGCAQAFYQSSCGF